MRPVYTCRGPGLWYMQMQFTTILGLSRYCFVNLSTVSLTEERHSYTSAFPWTIGDHLERNLVHTPASLWQAMPQRLCYIATHILCGFAQGLKTDNALLRKVPKSPSWSHNSHPLIGIAVAGLLTQTATDTHRISQLGTNMHRGLSPRAGCGCHQTFPPSFPATETSVFSWVLNRHVAPGLPVGLRNNRSSEDCHPFPGVLSEMVVSLEIKQAREKL